ncbi:unnamed protein product [Cylicocyclus nassatus]|uniref:Fucosyltransferase n=1 Tax=Cylicocyclus nassatus TaxID=53992 RepID=A0AA36HAZ2_CYLNA|nr:unnamed protein product [Cylicocyclus nassatus]
MEKGLAITYGEVGTKKKRRHQKSTFDHIKSSNQSDIRSLIVCLTNPPKNKEKIQEYDGDTTDKSDSEFLFNITPTLSFYGEDVLNLMNISLAERMKCKHKKGQKRKIVFLQSDVDGSLAACPDWNCELSRSSSALETADAIIVSTYTKIKLRPNQYLVFYSQESPSSNPFGGEKNWCNMTIGFRQDSPVSSPYGYTVLNVEQIEKKTKGAAWFVSNCGASSGRESYVDQLKTLFPVDIYGQCGNLRCEHNDPCENVLDTDYHFYLAFENSICKDYVTEKLWKHGYQHEIVPIVLKRSLLDSIVPPNSFIAVDDFDTVTELAAYLSYLMKNKTAYIQYFQWKLSYRVVFLDGANHNALERPWGFCQLCRLLWEEPREKFVIEDFSNYWDNSCDNNYLRAFKSVKGKLGITKKVP